MTRFAGIAGAIGTIGRSSAVKIGQSVLRHRKLSSNWQAFTNPQTPCPWFACVINDNGNDKGARG